MKQIITGLEQFITGNNTLKPNEHIGLLANPASVDSSFTHAENLIQKVFPDQLTALFSPQHGFYAEKQDNMIESDHIKDSGSGIPAYSLYHQERKPSSEMMTSIDTLIVDIQDVGTRVYTFIYTLSYCMEAAAEYGKKVIVLDRPNPVGGNHVEGNCLSTDFSSFVGRYPIPMRHGLTIGEIALLFNRYFNIGCDLEVVPMLGWERFMYFHETGLPWVLPSPNLPTPESSYVYPGQVVFEGTNISEARGTTMPFEFFGAPFMNTRTFLKHLPSECLRGIHLRTVRFEPTSNKWQGTPCNGFQIHITDLQSYQPYLSSIGFLQACIASCDGRFEWKQPPYEYEYEKLPIDLILGSKSVRQRIENLESINDIEKSWLDELNHFKKLKKDYHLY